MAEPQSPSVRWDQGWCKLKRRTGENALVELCEHAADAQGTQTVSDLEGLRGGCLLEGSCALTLADLDLRAKRKGYIYMLRCHKGAYSTKCRRLARLTRPSGIMLISPICSCEFENEHVVNQVVKGMWWGGYVSGKSRTLSALRRIGKHEAVSNRA